MSVALLAGDIVECRVWCSDEEQAAVMTHFLEVNEITGGETTDQDVADQQSTLLAPLIKDLIPSEVTYDGVQAKVIRSTLKLLAASSVLGAGAGTTGSVGQGRQVSGLLAWTTRFSGPGARGRTYLPFPSTFSTSGAGFPTVAYLDAALAYGAAWFTTTLIIHGISSAGVQLVLCHRPTPEPDPTPISTIPIAGYLARGFWATQKRRGSYGRANKSPI